MVCDAVCVGTQVSVFNIKLLLPQFSVTGRTLVFQIHKMKPKKKGLEW